MSKHQPNQVRAGHGNLIWTAAQEAELLQLRREGLTREQCAQRLGRSKNAIIGKLDRLLRQGKSAGGINFPDMPKPKPKLHPKNNNPTGLTVARLLAPRPAPLPMPPALPVRAPVSIVKLEHRQCRYIGERPEVMTLDTPIYCGAPTDGGSWCPEHKARVWRPLNRS